MTRPSPTLSDPIPRQSGPGGLRTVAVIGTGLIGTSIALALSAHGATVHLSDRDPGNVLTAAALGAGKTEAPDGPVDLAVIAVPPAQVAAVLAECQRRGVARAYTDVASVKMRPLADIAALGLDTTDYVGSHPMAGRERSGPLAAQPGLFEGRPWVLTPGPAASPQALDAVHQLIDACGAVPVLMSPPSHDRAVALVSHAPHVVSNLMAARLQRAGDAELRLAGQGLRDVTRIAGSDPDLWVEILSANAGHAADVLAEVARELEHAVAALRSVSQADAVGTGRGPDDLRALLGRGREGHDRIPGKHGGAPMRYETVSVRIGDQPGELARLLSDVSGAKVNVEDMAIDHDPDQTGTVELMVAQGTAPELAGLLSDQGWPCDVDLDG